MSITDHRSYTDLGCAERKALARRWCVTSRRIRRKFAGIRDPRLRADIHRLINAYWAGTGTVTETGTGAAPEPTPSTEERAQALATVCQALLQQFDDDQAGAAEIRLVVHKRDTPSTSDTEPPDDPDDHELLWELRRLLASSGGTIADVAHALERRRDDVDPMGRELLHDEVLTIEMDLAMLKVLLSDRVDWDAESKRLIAGEVPPFEGPVVDEDDDEDESH
jgi:hypothetical protein